LSLSGAGGEALNKEFRDVLTRHSKVLPAVAMIEMIEEGSFFFFPYKIFLS